MADDQKSGDTLHMEKAESITKNGGGKLKSNIHFFSHYFFRFVKYHENKFQKNKNYFIKLFLVNFSCIL